MNRRTFLALLAATSLTPIIPAQVFASGGIVNPEHCGFVGVKWRRISLSRTSDTSALTP